MSSVITREIQHPCSVPPEKLFQIILAQDAHMHKINLPHAVKSSENIQGSGGPGTIKKISYANGGHGIKKLDVIDKDNYTFVATCFEADPWIEGLEKITFEVKLVAAPGGGSIFKLVTKYHAKAGHKLQEAQIDAVDQIAAAIPPAIEAYGKTATMAA